MPDLSTAPEPTGASYPDSKGAHDPFEDDAMVGKVLDGRYRIVRVLGMGGAGVVYEARQLELGHRVAVKLLRETYGDSDIARRRFRREAKLLSELAHPNIVRLTDYGVSDGCPYLVMEYLEGESLEQRLRRGSLAPEDGLSLMRDVVRALAFAHARRVLHRDLKPGNILLQDLGDGELHPKLLDFGLARLFADDVPESSTHSIPADIEHEDAAITGEESSSDDSGDTFEPALTRRGAILGTPTYMAPEQGSGEEVGPAADVYAVGVVLFEVLTGQVPFAAPRRSDLLQQHLVGKIPNPTQCRDGLMLAPALHVLIRRCLAKRPHDRHATATELQAEFDALPNGAARLVGQTNGTTSPARSTLSTAKLALLSALVLAVAVAVLAFAFEPRRSPESPNPAGRPELPETSASETTHPSEPETADLAAAANPEQAEQAEQERVFETLLHQLTSSESLDRSAHRAMRVYQRQHPDDPRPTLSLAHDLARHSSWTGAVERYALALSRWPDAAQDEHMLEDLLDAVERTGPHELAADLVVEYFPVALSEVIARRAESEHRPTRRVLLGLQQRLER